ncbi:MAG: hypothetical protein GX992_01600 [Clostridium sp.]|nr:hypothetical protein [Clostridium sp.]
MQNQNESFEQEDIQKNKAIAALSYLIFFLPFLVCPESKYAKFHANQALLVFIANLGGNIVIRVFLGLVLGSIPFLGWFIRVLLASFYGVFIFILIVMGIINAINGEAKKLPLFGEINLLK